MRQKKGNTKIALVAPSLAGGGAEKIVVSLSNYYCDLGYKVDLVLFNAKGPYLEQVKKGVNIVDLKLKTLRNIMNLHYVFPLRKYLKKRRPDTVLSALRKSNKILGLASIGIKNTRIVFREANTMHEDLKNNKAATLFHFTLMNVAYRFANVIIANSNDTARDIVKHKISKKEKVIVIPNPVLPDNYKALATKPIKDDFFSEKFKTILSIGRLAPQKNYPFLINAFQQVLHKHPNTRLVIIGEGDEYRHLLHLASELGIEDNFKILPFQQNIFPYINNSSVFALSSNWEGFGNVIVEALALGKPIVSTDCPGGPKSILDNGRYGKLIPLNDIAAFSKALEDSLFSQIDKNLLVTRATDFTINKIAKKYLDVLFDRH